MKRLSTLNTSTSEKIFSVFDLKETTSGKRVCGCICSRAQIYLWAIFFSAVFILFCPPTVFAGDKELSLTLEEAWRMVVGVNDKLKAARAKVEQAEYKEEGSKDLYLPEISLTANYIYLDDEVELSANDLFESMAAGEQAAQLAATLAQSYGLTASQLNAGLTSTIAERENFTSSIQAAWPIYTGGRITAARDIASSQVKEASFDLQLTTLGQFETLIRFYFGVVLSQHVLQTKTDVVTGLKTHRDHAVLLEEQGQIARVERMQAEAAYDKAMVERKKARRDLEIAQVALTRLLKAIGPVQPTDSLFVVKKLPGMNAFITNTLAGYPGLDILKSKKDQARGLANVEKGKYFPTVAVYGNYNLYEEDDLLTKLVPDWFVGVGVNIPLLERSGRSGKMYAARSAVTRLDHLYKQAESDLLVLVEKTYRQAMQAIEEYNGLRSSRKLAEETVQLRVKAFKQGLSTSLDVVDAELFLAGVKTQRAVAVYNYVLALGKLFVISSSPETFFTFQNNQRIEDN